MVYRHVCSHATFVATGDDKCAEVVTCHTASFEIEVSCAPMSAAVFAPIASLEARVYLALLRSEEESKVQDCCMVVHTCACMYIMRATVEAISLEKLHCSGAIPALCIHFRLKGLSSGDSLVPVPGTGLSG